MPAAKDLLYLSWMFMDAQALLTRAERDAVLTSAGSGGPAVTFKRPPPLVSLSLNGAE
jgi:hypothetical protein